MAEAAVIGMPWASRSEVAAWHVVGAEPFRQFRGREPALEIPNEDEGLAERGCGKINAIMA
jgi:hypothetical protein